MAEPFLSEIRIFSFNFPPKGWAFCNGQILPISQNTALFSLLGTVYGGDGKSTFALPNLRGRAPIHMGDGHTLGEQAGSTSVTITQQTMPTHLHFMQASSLSGNQLTPTNRLPANVQAKIYNDPVSLTTLSPQSVSSVGGSQPHNNMMPYLVLNFCSALQGIFPSRN